MSDEAPLLLFETPEAWEAWLEEHHTEQAGVWLKTAKKNSGFTSIAHGEALEVALCFGWLDGQVRRIDEQFFKQKWVPRRRRSTWSKINCAKAEELIAAGRMRPSGLAEVERAKADGRWEAAYDAPSTATVPDDLRAALDASPAAATAFAGLSGQNRYAILHRLMTARKPETRARRIETFVAMLERGETPHG